MKIKKIPPGWILLGLVLLIAYDAVIGIPIRVLLWILGIAAFWTLGRLNQRLEILEQSERLDALSKRMDGLNERLRWVEVWLFGNDRDDMMSKEWSERQPKNLAAAGISEIFPGIVGHILKEHKEWDRPADKEVEGDHTNPD
jgi:hypothetical protein